VLILGASAGVVAGLGAERAAIDQLGFAGADSVLVKRRLGQIPMDFFEVFETEFVGAVGTVPHTRFLHQKPSQTGRRLDRQSFNKPEALCGYNP